MNDIDIKKIKTDVSAIKNCLLGDEYDKNGGLIHKVQTHEKFIEKIKLDKAKFIGILITLNFLLFMFFSLVMPLILNN